MKDERKTLEVSEIETERTMGRRSSLRAVGAAVLGAAAIAAGGAAAPPSAKAQTDSDSPSTKQVIE